MNTINTYCNDGGLTCCVYCSNVAYHGELEKKAAMEQKRVMTGENGETDGDGEYQELKNLVQDVKNEKENGFTM